MLWSKTKTILSMSLHKLQGEIKIPIQKEEKERFGGKSTTLDNQALHECAS